MAGDGGSRRFLKLGLVLAFMMGVAAGALSATLAGIPETLWAIAFCGAVAAAVGMYEWFGEARTPAIRFKPTRWGRPRRRNFALAPQRKVPKVKAAPRRGQLHAITGRKAAEPPNSGAS
jgi:hypothetical protein